MSILIFFLRNFFSTSPSRTIMDHNHVWNSNVSNSPLSHQKNIAFVVPFNYASNMRTSVTALFKSSTTDSTTLHVAEQQTSPPPFR